MPESIGSVYPTQIPTYEEAADIKAALKLYHYGTTTPGVVQPDSIAGHLADLQASVDAIVSLDVVAIGADEDLNDYTTSGYYNQASNASARSVNSANYPTFNNQAYAGLLAVIYAPIDQVADNGFVYQEYQMVGDVTARFYRTRTSAGSSSPKAWSVWARISESTHTHPDLYYTKTETNELLNGKEATIAITASRALASDSNGKVSASTVTTTQLQYLSGASGTTGTTKLVFSDAPTFSGNVTMGTPLSVANGGTGGTTKATARTGVGIFVQSTEPDSSVRTTGDLWFW
jgi:hypothetical protein